MYRSRTRSDETADKIKLIMSVVVVTFVLVFWAAFNLNVQELQGTVGDKFIKRTSKFEDSYHVMIENHDGKVILQNRDSWWWGKFDSADVQYRMEVGKEYRLTVTGWRIPLLSMFQNIVKVEEIPK